MVGLARGPDVPTIVADLLLVPRKLASAVLERWLATRPGARALSHFEAAIDALATLVDADADAAAIAEADVEIVARLVHATKSPVLELCFNPIVAVLRKLPALRDAMYAAPNENVLGPRALASWLRARDASTLPLALAELERRDAATVARLRRRGPA